MPSPTGLLFIATPLLLAAMGMAMLRRHPRRLLELRLDWPVLLWLAAIAAALRYTRPGWLAGWATQRGGSLLLAVAWAAALAWVGLNLRRRGTAMRASLVLAGLGLSCNALTILVNAGRMPFSLPAARAVGMPQAALQGHAPLNVPLTASHHLSWLADLIAVPGLDKVISIGDLMLVVGVAAVLLFATDRSPGHPTQPRHENASDAAAVV